MNDKATVSVSTARIVLFGSEGGFSRPVLQQLLAHGLSVAAVVIADTAHVNSNFPIRVEQPVKPNGLAELAMKNKLAVLTASNMNDQVFIKQLKDLLVWSN